MHRVWRLEPGLPPRARGSRNNRAARTSLRGPTPACAGITNCRIESAYADEAYPRVRGDHLRCTNWRSTRLGLPPRARGSPEQMEVLLEATRPTPACAGITRRFMLPARRERAYPRVRGDHGRHGQAPAGSHGLPPRARGSLFDNADQAHDTRPTPACAGITAGEALLKRALGAYPRVRGDHRVHLSESLTGVGLPPRARGSQPGTRQVEVNQRPTPACAGITLRS